jgi:hypothetical protein
MFWTAKGEQQGDLQNLYKKRKNTFEAKEGSKQ